MKPASTKVMLGYAIFIAVAALFGLSVTRTEALKGEDSAPFVAGGTLTGVAVAWIFHVLKDRVALCLPPAKYLRGLKIFLVGFSIAVLGWFIAVFYAVEVGAKVGFLAALICFLGMGVHFFHSFKSK